MTLLASVLYTSLVAATAIVEVGCSSDDSSTAAAPPPYDAGHPSVPDASAGAGSVTVAVACPTGVTSCGYVVSSDGTPQDGGPNGFVGVDGGAPVVDCGPSGGACVAPQDTTLYVSAVLGYTFVEWTVPVEGGIAILNTDMSIQITAGIGSPLTATFAAGSSGPDASVPVIVDSGVGGG